MELLVSNETQFCQSHMWFKHGEKLEHIVANHVPEIENYLPYIKHWKTGFFSLRNAELNSSALKQGTKEQKNAISITL